MAEIEADKRAEEAAVGIRLAREHVTVEPHVAARQPSLGSFGAWVYGVVCSLRWVELCSPVILMTWEDVAARRGGALGPLTGTCP